jgi:DNA-binding response OmpR family regulator
MPHRLLIIEDDRDLARNLVDYLGLRGYVVDYAPDGFSAENLLKRENYDLIVLDLNLPGIDGISLCKRYRHEMYGRTPLVILTAQDDVDVKISALDIGADDYVVKPVSLRELDARIRALIRRAGPESEGTLLTVGDLRFDTGTMRIERAGQSIILPPIPMRILALLMRHSPNVVLQRTIFREIWSDDAGDKHALLVHMHALRTAVDKPFERQLIHTVRGFGYRMAQDNAPL